MYIGGSFLLHLYWKNNYWENTFGKWGIAGDNICPQMTTLFRSRHGKWFPSKFFSGPSIYTMYSLSLKLSRVLSIILTNPFKCQVALRFWIFGKANMRMTCIYVPICGGQEVWCCSSVWLYFYLPFLMIRSITCFSNFWQFCKN